MAIFIICLTLLISASLLFLEFAGVVRQWPKISIVSFIQSGTVLLLYYSPLFGLHYYMANMFVAAFLIILLVHIASVDPSPNWSYRAMCWTIILQIMVYGAHILTDFSFVYYDSLSLLTSLMEIAVLLSGGFNVKRIVYTKVFGNCDSIDNCSNWVRSPHKN